MYIYIIAASDWHWDVVVNAGGVAALVGVPQQGPGDRKRDTV